jgi:cellulose biosynthesis protein BcsQ
MKSIVFFNNKGGVGKTTLTGNVAAHIAKKSGKRVCIIDCDPQCNITQLLLGDEKTIELYWGESSPKQKKASTVLDVVQPIMDGDAGINAQVSPQLSTQNRFGVDILPGHPRLSAVEDVFSRAWTDLTASKVGGFRITFWLRAYLKSIENQYDYVFIDVSPSLGSINRSVLISADYFLTPLGSDIFSLLGIRNIAQWTQSWLSEYETAYSNAKLKSADQIKRYSLPEQPGISKGYIGYTVQQYITKSKQGERRATVAFEKIINKVPAEIAQYLGSYLPTHLIGQVIHLGDVPNLYSIIPLAQNVRAPIFALESKDKLVGAQFQQSEKYAKLIAEVAEKIVENTGA